MEFIVIGYVLLLFVVQFCFAAAVFRNAEVLDNEERLNFVGPWVWFWATLLGGVMIATAFWAMHYSRLSPAVPGTQLDSSIP